MSRHDSDEPVVIRLSPSASSDFMVDLPRTPGPTAGGPESTHLSIPTSTPIKKDKPIHAFFSTLTQFRNPILHSIGKRMRNSFVGPMPADLFLETFLPARQIPQYQQVTTYQPLQSFKETAAVEGELAMYSPFVKEVQRFAPQLSILDTHTRGDTNSGYAFQIKPDISIYHKSQGSSSPKHCKVDQLDMFVEFKWYDYDDPFVVPSESTSRDHVKFIGSTSSHRDTIGQIAAYVAAQLASQFRTHAFSVFVVRDRARIIRWDREGAIVTEPISYNTSPLLAEFFSRFSQAPPNLRGVDTTIVEATGDEAARARKKLGLGENVRMLKTYVPTPGDSRLTIIFAKPSPHPSVPTCRATRACPAYDIEGDRLVFFKDSWRLAIDDVTPEGTIYSELRENGVRFVPRCLASGDVESWAEQKTQTQRLSFSSWACSKDLHLLSHSHYRLVLDIVGNSLIEFGSSKELVQVIHDALVGHKEAFLAGYIHRDISPGNIIIFNGHGYLIDWDLAKSVKLAQPRRSTRTGTWQFMSARLVEDRSSNHTCQDDLESSLWVLLWTVLMFSESSFDTETLSSFIRRTFESGPGGEEKRSFLTSQTKLTPNLFPGRPALYELIKELADLFKGVYHTPKAGDEDTYEFLRSKFADSTELPAVLGQNLYHHHITSKARLDNHVYILDLFSRYLQEGMWPDGDSAKAQPLSGLDADGQETGHVLLASKHILSRLEEEDRVRKRARTDAN